MRPGTFSCINVFEHDSSIRASSYGVNDKNYLPIHFVGSLASGV